MPTFLTRPWVWFLTALLAGGLFLLIITNISRANTPDSPKAPANNPAKAVLKSSEVNNEYLALGDSVAYGVGASPPTEEGYAGTLYSKYLQKSPLGFNSYKNFSVPGETSPSFIKRSNTQNQLDRAVQELDRATKSGVKVKLITLTLGGNDMIRAMGGNDTLKLAAYNAFDANLETILNQLTAHLNNTSADKTAIILTTYYSPFVLANSVDNQDLEWLTKFNNAIRRRADQFKAKVADFYGSVLGREKELTWISKGDIHPTPAGHNIFATVLWEATGYKV